MLKLVPTAVLAGVLFVVQIAEAGFPTPQVPVPATLGLLTAGAAIIAVGSWWRSRRK